MTKREQRVKKSGQEILRNPRHKSLKICMNLPEDKQWELTRY